MNLCKYTRSNVLVQITMGRGDQPSFTLYNLICGIYVSMNKGKRGELIWIRAIAMKLYPVCAHWCGLLFFSFVIEKLLLLINFVHTHKINELWVWMNKEVWNKALSNILLLILKTPNKEINDILYKLTMFKKPQNVIVHFAIF